LPEATDDFETEATEIVQVISMNDERFGVEHQERVLEIGSRFI
jgi:hypothetical protein